MAKLKDMLEPGEKVLHRGNLWRALLPVLFWLAAISVALVAGVVLMFLEDIPEHPIILTFAVGVGLLPAAIVLGMAGPFIGLGEACVFTDRRILFKQGLFRPRIAEMTLSGIDRAEFGGALLRLGGAGRTLDIPAVRNGLTAPVLARILPRWVPDAGKPMARPGHILQPGERLIFRYPSPWFNRVLRGLMLCMAGFFAWTGYGDLIDGDWSGAWNGAFYIVIMLSLVTNGATGRHGWYCIVTNRRLLQHFDWDPSRYEEIPLAEIDAEWRSRFADKLTARHNGRDLDIPAEDKDAERVLAAIEAAKGGA